ncbi:hypothetical protein [Acinetobacter junii]
MTNYRTKNKQKFSRA